MTTRTPQDYALEHAEYLAKQAERLIEAIGAHAVARQDEYDDADIDSRRDDEGEAVGALRTRIYEFRKRRDRALRESGWLPIESAPLDGTEILLISAKGRIANGCRMTANEKVGGWMWPYINQEPVGWMRLPPSTKGEGTNGTE